MEDLALVETQTVAASKDAIQVLDAVRAMPLTPANLGIVNDLLVQVRDQAKTLKARRDEILAPIKDAADRVKALFAPPLEALGSLEAVIREKVAAAALAQREADTAARALAAKAAQDGDTAGVVAALATVAGTRGGLDNLAVTYAWEGVIVDFDRIPREWLTVDLAKVKIHCRDHAKSETIPPVPGLEFKRTASTRAK